MRSLHLANIDRVHSPIFFFKEIIEGLVHIHTQGMIHRDLKPVNVFIDSMDHVKIGDFGLATTSFFAGGTARLADSSVEASDSVACREGEDMTGQIGTALYVAPELAAGKSITYSQKVRVSS